MRRSALFFGSLIVLLGVVLLGINLGVVTSHVWRYFWPLVLVLLGVWFILGPYIWKGSTETVQRSIPLSGDSSAEITVNYGAGRMNVGPSTDAQELLGGSFAGGLSEDLQHVNGKAVLKVNPPADIFPGTWIYGNKGFEWDVRLNKDIPLQLHFHTGACETHLNLLDLKVSELTLETGASSTDIQLPAAAGFTRVTVKSGAAEVKLRVPQGVAASISESSGLSGIDVDTTRFVQNGRTYQSADYATAANKVEIFYEGGVGSVSIH